MEKRRKKMGWGRKGGEGDVRKEGEQRELKEGERRRRKKQSKKKGRGGRVFGSVKIISCVRPCFR